MSVQSVERAFAVLRAIAQHSGGVGVSTIARESGLPKSTVARLLVTMEGIGAVERMGDDSGYHIGPAIGALAGDGIFPAQVAAVVRPYLRELVDVAGEDAGLAVPDGDHVLYVDQVHTQTPVQVQDWTGQRLPPHTVASGFVFMASWEPDRLDSYLAEDLEPFTPQTLVDPVSIRRRIGQVADDGFAWTREEFAEGINGVAAPIHGDRGEVIAALNLYGPAYRFPGDTDAAEVERRVVKVADAITAHLANQMRSVSVWPSTPST